MTANWQADRGIIPMRRADRRQCAMSKEHQWFLPETQSSTTTWNLKNRYDLLCPVSPKTRLGVQSSLKATCQFKLYITHNMLSKRTRNWSRVPGSWELPADLKRSLRFSCFRRCPQVVHPINTSIVAHRPCQCHQDPLGLLMAEISLVSSSRPVCRTAQ